MERSYQTDCIEILTGEFHRGRRKMLVEMATGTGKTRTAAAFIKRLFEANAIRIFVLGGSQYARHANGGCVGRASDGFPVVSLAEWSAFSGREAYYDHDLQSMINIYRDFSAGYFDLVISG